MIYMGLGHQMNVAQVTGDDREIIQQQAGGASQLVEFYEEFPSLRLYCDTNSSSSAYYLARPRKWEQLKQEFMGWIRMLHDESSHGALPEWLDSAIVFGEIPEASNYLLMPTSGGEAGKVFLFEHNDFTFAEQAASFEAYIGKLISPDSSLFADIRKYTQYSDGESATKWLVEDYVYG